MTQKSTRALTQRGGSLSHELLQLPVVAGILKRDVPHAYTCMMLSLQSVAIAFLAHPHLLPDGLPSLAASDRVEACASFDVLAASERFMRLIYSAASTMCDTNWFGVQSKEETGAGVCLERLVEKLFLIKLQEIRGALGDSRAHGLYCVTFQTLNALQNTQCTLLQPSRRLLALCQQCAQDVSAFIGELQACARHSLTATMCRLKRVSAALLAVLCTCSPSESLSSNPKVLRVVQHHQPPSGQPSHQAVFRSISSAIAAATPGCVLLLHPGLYCESLSIRTSGLVIVSDCAHAGCSRCDCTRSAAPYPPLPFLLVCITAESWL
jgi:hypothetical protein